MPFVELMPIQLNMQRKLSKEKSLVQSDREKTVSCRRQVSYDNVYTKKPKFRRKLIEKYSTARYNINTRLICVTPNLLKMKSSSHYKFKRRSVRNRLRLQRKENVDEGALNVESNSKSLSPVQVSETPDPSQARLPELSSTENISPLPERSKRRDSGSVAHLEAENLATSEINQQDMTNSVAGRISSQGDLRNGDTISEKTVVSNHSDNDESNKNHVIGLEQNEAACNAPGPVTSDKSDASTERRMQPDISQNCATNHSSSVRGKKSYQLVSKDFHSYLLDYYQKSKENKVSHPAKRRKRKAIVMNRTIRKKAKIIVSNTISHCDPYLSSWTKSEVVDLPNSDENICMVVYLGVGRPLFPLIHRNIVTLNGRQDTKITDLWAEFALSTLTTAPGDCEIKPVLLPVKDPQLLSVISNFNCEWPAEYEEIELSKNPNSVITVTKVQKTAPVLADAQPTNEINKPLKKTTTEAQVATRKSLRSRIPNRLLNEEKPCLEADFLIKKFGTPDPQFDNEKPCSPMDTFVEEKRLAVPDFQLDNEESGLPGKPVVPKTQTAPAESGTIGKAATHVESSMPEKPAISIKSGTPEKSHASVKSSPTEKLRTVENSDQPVKSGMFRKLGNSVSLEPDCKDERVITVCSLTNPANEEIHASATVISNEGRISATALEKKCLPIDCNDDDNIPVSLNNDDRVCTPVDCSDNMGVLTNHNAKISAQARLGDGTVCSSTDHSDGKIRVSTKIPTKQNNEKINIRANFSDENMCTPLGYSDVHTSDDLKNDKLRDCQGVGHIQADTKEVYTCKPAVQNQKTCSPTSHTDEKTSPQTGRNSKTVCEKTCSPTDCSDKTTALLNPNPRKRCLRSLTFENDDYILRKHGYQPCHVVLPKLEHLLDKCLVAELAAKNSTVNGSQVMADASSYILRKKVNKDSTRLHSDDPALLNVSSAGPQVAEALASPLTGPRVLPSSKTVAVDSTYTLRKKAHKDYSRLQPANLSFLNTNSTSPRVAEVLVNPPAGPRTLPIEDASDDDITEDNFFGYNHSSRTYGLMIDYRLRNRSSVYFYKMRRMLNFQKKNNRHFQVCCYYRVYYSRLLEECCEVDVLSEAADYESSVLQSEKSKEFDQLCGPSFVRSKILEAEVESIKSMSHNPLDVVQSPQPSNLVGLKAVEDCEPNKNQYSIQFVDIALLKERISHKWVLLQLNQRVTNIIYNQSSALTAKLLFEVIYRADLTKKVVCHAVTERGSIDSLKFGVYGIPGLCNAVIIGPYDPREQSHLLEATIRSDDNVDTVFQLRATGEVNAFWWRPKVAMRNSFGVSDINVAYLNFIFKSSIYKQPQTKHELKLNDLLRKHAASKYCFFGEPFEFNCVLLHEEADGKLNSKYNYIPVREPLMNSVGNSGKPMEYKYVPLTDFLPAFDLHDDSLPKYNLPKGLPQVSPKKSRLRRSRKLKSTPPGMETCSDDSCGSTAGLLPVVSERIRRREFTRYRNNLCSLIPGDDSRSLNAARDATLFDILNKATEIIRTITEENELLMREEERLKFVRKKLIYRYAVLLRSIHPSNPAYQAGKKFLSELFLPKRAVNVVNEFNLFWKKLSANDSLRLTERIRAVQEEVHKVRNPLNEQSSLVDKSSSPSNPVTNFIGRKRSNEINKYAKRLSKSGRQSQLNKLKEWYSKSDRVTDLYQTTEKPFGLEVVATEPPYLEHSYSRVNLDPLSVKSAQNAHSVSGLPVSGDVVSKSWEVGRSFGFVKAPDSEDPPNDQPNQISVFLTENEKPISKIVINQLKSVSDKKDIPPTERRRQIVALIRRILQEMDTRYQCKDTSAQEERKTLVSRLQLLQRMLLGVNVNRSLSKTKVIGAIEISDDEEDITIQSNDKKYSCRIQHSTSTKSSKKESEIEYAVEDTFGTTSYKDCRLEGRYAGDQLSNIGDIGVSGPSIKNLSKNSDFEKNRWNLKRSKPKTSSCCIEERPFIENELPYTDSTESGNDLVPEYSLRTNVDEVIPRKRSRDIFSPQTENGLPTISALRKECSVRTTPFFGKQRYIPVILKRPGRNGIRTQPMNINCRQILPIPTSDKISANRFQSLEEQIPLSRESSFDIIERRIRCPSFVPVLKTAEVLAPEAGDVVHSEDNSAHVPESVVTPTEESSPCAFQKEMIIPGESLPFVLPEEAVDSEYSSAPSLPEPTHSEDSPELILPDEDTNFFENCDEAMKNDVAEGGRSDADERSSSTASTHRDTNDSGNESDMPYRLFVKSFASIDSFNSQALSNVDKLLKF